MRCPVRSVSSLSASQSAAAPSVRSQRHLVCRSVTSQRSLPPPALACLPVTGSAPPRLDEKIGVPGRASCFGGRRGLDPHSCSPLQAELQTKPLQGDSLPLAVQRRAAPGAPASSHFLTACR